jgi:hypothetical protein
MQGRFDGSENREGKRRTCKSCCSFSSKTLEHEFTYKTKKERTYQDWPNCKSRLETSGNRREGGGSGGKRGWMEFEKRT